MTYKRYISFLRLETERFRKRGAFARGSAAVTCGASARGCAAAQRGAFVREYTAALN